jgi:hypothetical protein
MKKTIIMLLLVCRSAIAQEYILTWDSRTQTAPIPEGPVALLDIGTTERTNSLLWSPEYMSLSAPCLFNISTKEGTPWQASLSNTQNLATSARTNRYTEAQKEGHRALRAVKQAVGLPPKTGKRETLQYLIEQSRTNANTQALKIQWSLYLSQVLAGKELLENVMPETSE